MADTVDPRRGLPAIEVLINHPLVVPWHTRIAPEFIARLARDIVSEERIAVSRGKIPAELHVVAGRCVRQMEELLQSGLKRVINATGIILHTGLGRAPLSADAALDVAGATGYAALEFDLASGERGDRQDHVEPLLCLLTGAESALVVNNNAGALYLVLNAMGYRREVIVSRGQLIEIGGSFRLPDIMQRSGVKIVEVGTTNRTRVADYQGAITDKTALFLRAHPSNYRIEGFAESVPIGELAALGRAHNIPVVDDLGSGVMWDWSRHGLPAEPTVQESLEAGADLVLVSGDKALGGPQAGIILGRRDVLARLKKSPLTRVLRPDKLILAALAATLRHFLKPDAVLNRVPVWHMLTESSDSLRRRAQRLVERLAPLSDWQVLDVRDSAAEAGSGTMPAEPIPSVSVCCLPRGTTAARWSRGLRLAPVPVVATVRHGLVWLDLRTISAEDEEDLVHSVASSLQKG